MQRHLGMDFGRAFAITLVTGYHVWRFVGSPHLIVGGIDLYSPFASGFVGVDLFFVISGCAMMMTWQSRNQDKWMFWRARLLRIYPAYATAVLVWVAFVQLGLFSRSAGIYDVLMHLLLIHTFDPNTFFSVSGVFWSLAVEAHFYLVFPFLVLLSRRVRWAIVIASLVYTSAIAWWLGDSSDPILFVAKWNMIGFLPLFALGMELHSLKRTPTIIACSLAALCVALILMFNQPSSHDMPGRMLIGGGLGVFCLVAIPASTANTLITAAIKTIAVASYSIYLHNYIFYLFQTPVVHGMTGTAVYGAIVFSFGFFMWWAIERKAETLRHVGKRTTQITGRDNNDRPRTSLVNLTPTEFARQSETTREIV
jgi:peptidoglycan/LPS O-acetylase OafA/YrhL